MVAWMKSLMKFCIFQTKLLLADIICTVQNSRFFLLADITITLYTVYIMMTQISVWLIRVFFCSLDILESSSHLQILVDKMNSEYVHRKVF